MRLRKVGVAYSALLISTIACKGLAVVSAAALGRSLGSAGLGMFGVAVTVLGFALITVNWGLDAIGTRETARAPESAVALSRRITRIRSSIAIAVSATMVVASIGSGWPVELAVPLSLIPIAFSWRLDWLLMAVGKERDVAVAAAVREAFYLATVVIFVVQARSPSVAIWCLLAAEVAHAALTAAASRSVLLRNATCASARGGTLISAGWPLVIMGFMTLTYTKADTLLIAHFLGAGQAGIYYASYSVLFGALSIAAPLARAAFPEMAKMSGTRTESGMFSLSLIAVGGGAVTAIVLALSAKPILHMLYGNGFLDGWQLLRILSLSVALTFASGVLVQGLIAAGKQSRVAALSVCAAVVGITCNLILIPRMGMSGAAVATIVTEAFVLGLAILGFRGSQGIHAFAARLVVLLGVFLCAWLLAVIVGSRWQPWVGAVLGIGAFLMAYWAIAWRSLRENGAAWRYDTSPDGVVP